MLGIAKFAMRNAVTAASLAAGLLLAGILALLTLGPFGSFISMLAVIASSGTIALVILRKGPSGGVKSASIGLLMLFGVAFAIGVPLQQMLLLALMIWLPVGIAASVLRQTVDMSLAILTVTVIMSIGVVVIHLVLDDPVGMWKNMLHNWFETMRAVIEENGGEPLPSDDVERYTRFIAVMAKLMTGAMAATSLWLSVLALLLARSWQARLFNPGGFQPEFHGLRLGKGAALVSIGICIVSLVSGMSLLTSLATVVIAAFLFQGMAVVHALVKNRGMSQGWLLGVYAMLLLLQTSVLLGALGMVDNWLNLRKT